MFISVRDIKAHILTDIKGDGRCFKCTDLSMEMVGHRMHEHHHPFTLNISSSSRGSLHSPQVQKCQRESNTGIEPELNLKAVDIVKELQTEFLMLVTELQAEEADTGSLHPWMKFATIQISSL